MLTKLLRYLKGYRRQALLGPLLVVVSSVCELIIPRLMTTIIDEGIDGAGGFPTVLRSGLVMIGLTLVALVIGAASVRFAAIGSQGFGYNLRKALFDHTQEFSFADIDRFSSASLITRLTNDVNNIQMMINMGLQIMVRAPVMLVFALGMCFSINARLTLVLVIVVPLMALAVAAIMRAAHKLFDTMQKRIDGLNNTVQENLIAIRVVKAFVREGYEKTKFARSNDAMRDAAVKAVSTVVFLQPVMMLAFNFSIVLIMWFGGQMVIGDTLTRGELFSLLSYIFNVLISVMMVAFSLLQITRAQASAGRIVEVLDTVPDIRDKEGADAVSLPEARGKVEFRDVSFRYRAGAGDDVLSHIDLTIQPGEFVAVIGGTGVGKSSLVNLIPRFYDVSGGAVLVDGVDVRDYPVAELRKRIGMVLQKNVLFTGTIRENLLWGDPDATEEQIAQAAEDAKALEFILARPDGMDTFMEQGGVNVSGGQKQRLCIARAMLRHPSILILDDSTSAVDTATEASIQKSFKENLKGTTVIIIAQRISSVKNADKIVILEDDHIAGLGTHDELLATNAIYQDIYNSQQEGVSA